MKQSLSFHRGYVALVLLIATFGVLGAASATPARASNNHFITYCATRLPPERPCSAPPGYRNDPCGDGHSYGGWGGNFADYYGTGRVALYLFGERYTPPYGSCNPPYDLCYYRSDSYSKYHINDGNCVGTYSYYAHVYINLFVGEEIYTHVIYGTGGYP